MSTFLLGSRLARPGLRVSFKIPFGLSLSCLSGTMGELSTKKQCVQGGGPSSPEPWLRLLSFVMLSVMEVGRYSGAN